jgi:hypothetical protein
LDDQSQTPKIASAIVTLLTIVFAYGFIHGNLQSPRPYSQTASSHIPDTEDNHRVESRLWEDPFESFESPSNQTDVAGKSLSQALKDDLTNSTHQLLWNDIAERASNAPIAILGVMMEGGSYPQNKEVRLRIRYATELALLTQDVGPEDSTHIYTNSVWLNRTDLYLTNIVLDTNLVFHTNAFFHAIHANAVSYTNSVQIVHEIAKDSRLSQYAYEWFRTENDSNNRQVCVLWLNEDDFGDDPASRLGSLMTNIPALTEPTNNCNRGVSFYLIGPRSSDTLRALAYTDTNKLLHDAPYTNLTTTAILHNFYILSPEATASVVDSNLIDPNGVALNNKLNTVFGTTNVFHNWITPDERLATIISEELSNRMPCPLPDTNNVVVLLSEQDTYYGRKLADALTYELVTNQVCADTNHVWQFSYLRGLDGSKPQAEAQDQSPVLADTPEAALQTAMEQQQGGERADGDSQMDYILRLGEFLKKRDKKMEQQGHGRIIAFGIVGSDTYDKLILLQALRHKFPEALFFTTDLDASLWTSKELSYTRGLIVGSAWPVNPVINEANPRPATQQFAPFRGDYQTAIFRVCTAVAEHEKGAPLAILDTTNDLRGKLYIIGWHGPVMLKTDNNQSQEYDAINPRWGRLIIALMALVAMLVYFFAGSQGGILWGWKSSIQTNPSDSLELQKAKNDELNRQIDLQSLLDISLTVLFVMLTVGLFVYFMIKISYKPGEEPFNFNGGISIWVSETIRLAAFIMAILFCYFAVKRRKKNLRLLWENYFRECDTSSNWGDFYTKIQKKSTERRTIEFPSRFIEKLRGFIAQLGNEPPRPREYSRPLVGKLQWLVRKLQRFRSKESGHEPVPALINARVPPFIERSHNPGTVKTLSPPCIDAAALFKEYIQAGHWISRSIRVCFCIVVYLLLFVSLGFFLNDMPSSMPTFLLIRGHLSRLFNNGMLYSVVLLNMCILFYVMDRTFLLKRLLNYISRHATCWPDRPLQECADKFGVKPEHLDGLLDVDFAAIQTAEIGPLMSAPIIIQLLLLISRDTWFDSWPWPTSLILIFAINFLMASVCLWTVRQVAGNVREDALERLEDAEFTVRNSTDDTYNGVDKKIYLKNLKRIRKQIEDERRGAFAKWFQDPTYAGVFIPSGISGIISLLGSFLVNR